ncbi:hypothetical protein SpCBS45565_g05100 [Spizellomyces sp. 'palustris']|nr:hypothetical protein SpCBS45565_g05100 [Spizellomyces sp. 'palustris']
MEVNFNVRSSSSSRPQGLRRKDMRKEAWDKRYEDSRKGTRHSLKLPTEHRTRFQEPYDSYLSHLLDLFPSPAHGCSIPRSFIDQARRLAPRGSGWTVWLSTELRQKFRDKKSQLVCDGNVTHGEFVELLLSIEEGQPGDAFKVEADIANSPSKAWNSPSEASGADYSCDFTDADVDPSLTSVDEKDELFMKDYLSGLAAMPEEAEPLPPYRDQKSSNLPLRLSDTPHSILGYALNRRPSAAGSSTIALAALPINPSNTDTHAPPYRPMLGPGETNEPLPPYLDVNTKESVAATQWELENSDSSPDTLLSYADSEAVRYDDSAPPSPLLSWSVCSIGQTEDRPLTEDYKEIFGAHGPIDEPLPSYECSVADADGNAGKKRKEVISMDITSLSLSSGKVSGQDKDTQTADSSTLSWWSDNMVDISDIDELDPALEMDLDFDCAGVSDSSDSSTQMDLDADSRYFLSRFTLLDELSTSFDGNMSSSTAATRHWHKENGLSNRVPPWSDRNMIRDVRGLGADTSSLRLWSQREERN